MGAWSCGLAGCFTGKQKVLKLSRETAAEAAVQRELSPDVRPVDVEEKPDEAVERIAVGDAWVLKATGRTDSEQQTPLHAEPDSKTSLDLAGTFHDQWQAPQPEGEGGNNIMESWFELADLPT